MMNFEEFKRRLIKDLADKIDIDIIYPYYKTNQVVTVIRMKNKNQNEVAFPLIVIENCYRQYKESNYEETLKSAYELITSKPYLAKNLKQSKLAADFRLNLINTGKNELLLKNVPHRTFCDLSVVCRAIVEEDDDKTCSFIVKKSHLRMLGLDENEMFEKAYLNTEANTIVKQIIERLKELSDFSTMPDYLQNEGAKDPIFVISNKTGINGASGILSKPHIKKLAEQLNSDLYILPSSIHECIAVPVSNTSASELFDIVHDVNINEVEEHEFLSDNVYFFNRKTEKISIA